MLENKELKRLVLVKGILDRYIRNSSTRSFLYGDLLYLLKVYDLHKQGKPSNELEVYLRGHKESLWFFTDLLFSSMVRGYHKILYDTLDKSDRKKFIEYGVEDLLHSIMDDNEAYKDFVTYTLKILGLTYRADTYDVIEELHNSFMYRKYLSTSELNTLLGNNILRGTEVTYEDVSDKVKVDINGEVSSVRIDEVDSESKSIDDNDGEICEVDDEVIELVSAIEKRIEAVFRSCFELDRPVGMLYPDGMLKYNVYRGKVTLKAGVGQGKRSLFENLYNAIVKGCGYSKITDVNVANDLRLAPTGANIANKGYTYYPGFMLKYGLGSVDDKVYRTWNNFNKALKTSLERRLGKFYRDGIFYDNITKIESAYSFSILVLSYDRGTGIKLRVSAPGMEINKALMESYIKKISTYSNASISIVSVKDYIDVVDVQILQNEDEYLNKPSWAYKAMEVKLANGDAVSLTEGVPMGRKVNGEVVSFALDPSKRFMTFLAAGSGAGKGVLTLSLLSAAVGSGIPIMYTDYKPDMARIFWDLEKELGVKTYSYDGMLKCRDTDTSEKHSLGYGLPASLEGELGKYAGMIMYLKSVQLMCAMAQERAKAGFDTPVMFIFDEIEAMQLNIKGLGEKVSELEKKLKPAKNEEPSADYLYVKTLIDWIVEVNANINTYANTTGRTSATFTLWIAQTPDYTKWNDLSLTLGGNKLMLLGIPTTSNTVSKILGKGSTTSKYGLGGDGKKSVTAKELSYVTNNRHFGMYDGKTTDGVDITIFKPFLTLNTDDLKAQCWYNGLGKVYGAGDIDDDEYFKRVADEHPAKDGYVGKQGTHSGLGFYGLASMYCGGNKDKLKQNLSLGYEYAESWFKKVGLSDYYSEVADYIYDCSLDGLIFLGNMIKFDRSKLNSIVFGSGDADSVMGDSEGFDEDGEFVINLGEDVEGVVVDSVVVEADTSNYNTEIEDVNLVDFGIDTGINLDDVADIGNIDLGFNVYNNTDTALDNSDNVSFKDNNFNMGTENNDVDDIVFEDEIGARQDQPRSNFNSYRDRVVKMGTKASNIFNGNGNIFNVGAVQKLTSLNETNSINCNEVNRLTFKDRMLLKTPKGMDKYIANRFDRVLQNILRVVSVDLITRVRLLSNGMYINNKYVNDGLGGGDANVRYKDLVVFKVLFKRFLNLKELVVDESLFDVLVLEYGSIENLFNTNTRLESLGILKYGTNGKGQLETIKRDNLGSAVALENGVKLRAAMDVGKLKFGKFDGDKLNSESLESLRLSQANLGRAKQHLDPRNKVSFGKGLWYGTLGLVGGFIGGIGLAVRGLSKNAS